MKKDTFHLNISTSDNLGIGLFKYSLLPDEKFIITNSMLAKMLGYSLKSEFKNLKLDNLFLNAQDRDVFFKTLKKKKRIKFFETTFRKKNGGSLWVAITASQIGSRDKKYLEGIIEDISLHRQMEEKLALERDFMQGLLDNIPDAIYFKDRQNKIIKVNKFYVQGLNLKYEDIIGKTDFDFFSADQAKRMLDDDNYVLNTGKPIVGKIEHNVLPDGSWSQVITTKIPMYDRNGKIIGTMGITRDMTAYANLERERLDMLINALTVLSRVLEMRDPYTSNHNNNVANIAEKIARVLGWDENRLLGIRLAGQLHDLGKIGIPLDILNKPGKLSNLEYRLIQEHVKKCYDIIKDVNFPFSLAETIYQHHERLDGSGYPRELKQDGIILEARILAISDVLESMTSYRPYREALGLEKAMLELQEGSGSRYDSEIVKIVFNLVKDNQGKVFWGIN
ncbi:MAG: PAS domain S-box protein [Candidatus Omnitrophica bacterium]|nr:PAS domain S-box protein [Candidatus Omnitrophota bacterium]MDD5351921.1 PAS domain S-box protein [Candidatus Omnitrophota bacterium]MDD5550747.1 PAS domain S-box protein [Candidatus Omnitrophota bacterium]